MTLDPDVLSKAKPLVLADLKYANGSPLLPRVDGYSESGDRRLPAGTYLLGQVQVRGGPLEIAAGTHLIGIPSVDSYLYANVNGQLIREDGVTMDDARVAVDAGCTGTLTATSIRYTTNAARDCIWAKGTLTGTDVSIEGFGFNQEGVELSAGGSVTLTGALLTGLRTGAILDEAESLTLTDATVSESLAGVRVSGKGQATLTRVTFIDTDTARAFEAIETTSVSGGGAKLALEDLTFNLGTADASLRFDLDTFRTTNTVTYTGSFTGAGGGKGMRIYGSLASGVATIATPFVGAPGR